MRSSGQAQRRVAELGADGKVTMPLNESMPDRRGTVGLDRSAGEAVEDGAGRDALCREHLERLVPRLAGVDDERQFALVGHRDLGGEDAALFGLGEWS